MHINVPKNIRIALYVVTAVGSPLVAYLAAVGVIGQLEVALWSAEVTVVSSIAALNVPKSEQ